MSYRYEQYRERPRRRGLLATLVILVWVILIALLLIRFVARPLLTNIGLDRIAERIDIPGSREEAPPASESVQLPDNVLPENVQPGSFAVTDAAANQWLADHRAELQGIDDVQMRFVPGEVQADVTVRGVTSTAYAGVTVENGQIIVTDARLDPPLGLILDVQPFANLLQQRLNSDLATTGQQVTGVTIEQGRLNITIQ